MLTLAGMPQPLPIVFRVHLPQPSKSPTQQRWSPCRDSQIMLANGELQVNGQRYGAISAGAPIVVDHGAVYVSGRELQPVQQ
jgi:hypothetical protein